MQENDYTLALQVLTPELILARLSNYNDKDIDSQVDRVNSFRRKNPKTPLFIINGVIVFLLMIKKGKLPNDRYLKLTLDTFTKEKKMTSAEDVIEFITKRKNDALVKKNEKQENRKNYVRNNIQVQDISEVMHVSKSVVLDTHEKLLQIQREKLNQS
jgi:hypothetical protein